ncbi:MAG: FtsX-like permease family protein, partial [Oscillospiraceae bacterium]|nr:FtsX-like permease family protein [Oscillospiraceae bacterium]
RVAIARAIATHPPIIMADEPTGALDSATGRQILTTLKKLSSDKLVIVVSHDREFAEQYADRIVELADGKVIRDVERRAEELSAEAMIPVYEEDSVSLPREYHLTEEDRQAICDYIENMVSQGKEPKFTIQGSIRESFHPTDQTGIQSAKDGYHLIKSKLPMKHAFKIGTSGLKHKKFRLVMTILLSCVAFVLFGLADTMASYDYVTTSVSSLSDPSSQITYAAFEKQVGIYREEYDYTYWDYGRLTEEDYARIKEETGVTMYPVFSTAGQWESGLYLDMSFGSYLAGMEDRSYYYAAGFAGYVETGEELLKDMGAKLAAGSLPKNADELAISSFVLESFKQYGYRESYEADKVAIRSAADMIGKTLTMDGITYTVTGVVDTGIDYTRYNTLKEELKDDADLTDQIVFMVLYQELRYSLNYSLSGLAMVAPGQIQRINDTLLENRDLSGLLYIHGKNYGQNEGGIGRLDQLGDTKVVWLDGQERTTLSENEIILSEREYMNSVYGNNLENSGYDFSALYASENPDYSQILSMSLTMDTHQPPYNSYNVRIVGIIPEDQGCSFSHIISDSIFNLFSVSDEPMVCQTIAAMPGNEAGIRKIVEFSDMELTDKDGNPVVFNLMNPISYELKSLDEVFEVMRTVFLWVGVVFVIFASLLFSNFIATSISYKKREIGILRAIGSRSNDVFRIFFAESFVIAMINFVLSLLGTSVICGVINYFIRYRAGILLTILNVGIRQVALLFGICLLVAAVASFLPVRKIAAKRPIDAIRDR